MIITYLAWKVTITNSVNNCQNKHYKYWSSVLSPMAEATFKDVPEVFEVCDMALC